MATMPGHNLQIYSGSHTRIYSSAVSGDGGVGGVNKTIIKREMPTSYPLQKESLAFLLYYFYDKIT